MGNEKMAYELFQFLRAGVSVEALQEATDKAFNKPVNEEHIGFKRLAKEVEKGGASKEEAEATAAKIGRKKYEKEVNKFSKKIT